MIYFIFIQLFIIKILSVAGSYPSIHRFKHLFNWQVNCLSTSMVIKSYNQVLIRLISL
jgi:hypothetical protein